MTLKQSSSRGTRTEGSVKRSSSEQEKRPSFFSKQSREFIRREEEARRVITVFLENIPSRWSSIDVYKEMSMCGHVMDIFPGKLSWNGVRYGFVRFENQGTMGEIVEHINRRSNDMLCANLAKKSRILATSNRDPKGKAKVVPTDHHQDRLRALGGKMKDGFSFSQAVKLEPSQPKDQNRMVDKVDVNLVFHSPDECTKKLKACALAVIKDGIVSYDICKRVRNAIDATVDVKNLGGSYVLIAFESRNTMLACLNAGVLGDLGILDEIKAWDEGDCARNRVVWVNVYRVPPEAWCNEFFRQVTTAFGNYIKLYNSLDGSNDLSVAKVQILTTRKHYLEGCSKVRINGRMFDIRIEEVSTPYPFEMQSPLDIQIRSPRSGPSSSSGRSPSCQPDGGCQWSTEEDGGSSQGDPVDICGAINDVNNGLGARRHEEPCVGTRIGHQPRNILESVQGVGGSSPESHAYNSPVVPVKKCSGCYNMDKILMCDGSSANVHAADMDPTRHDVRGPSNSKLGSSSMGRTKPIDVFNRVGLGQDSVTHVSASDADSFSMANSGGSISLRKLYDISRGL
ncbi:hypothetical protein Tsubulata_049351 [Turnera subulata]|uniref:RRM domain-containing protein n=1 Tax=Turnera subulata TaxID=218843 RepID=A0A9Q0GCB9_9ROSI|nr:hypothetical protein Tsubulata_049351 [Turnera subulata]